MSTQRVSSVKIPLFDKENYGLWKKKMMLFLQMVNPKYLGVLKNCNAPYFLYIYKYIIYLDYIFMYLFELFSIIILTQ